MSSQASSTIEKGLPFRCRTSSTDQQPRPTPGAGNGTEGAQPTRQRVIAADGRSSGSRLLLAQRRSSNIGVAPSAAAS